MGEEEQPEQAAEGAEEELADGAQVVGHAKDGRPMIRTRGGTMKLGTLGAPKGKAGGRGKDGWAKPSGKLRPVNAVKPVDRGQPRVKEELAGSDQTPQARLRRAVAFLTKPQMLKRTWDQKRSFLKSQGLNEEEIAEARQRAEWAGAPAAAAAEAAEAEEQAQEEAPEEAPLQAEDQDAEPAETFDE